MSSSMPPATRALLLSNVVVFAAQLFFNPWLLTVFALWPPTGPGTPPGAPSFEAWQLVTHAFLHGGFSHIFFNMFALWMFGGEIERLLGTRRFAVYYLACVVGGAVTQLVANGTMDMRYGPMLGASGAIFGILLAFGMAYPRRRIMLLFPPIPMPAWLFVTLYGVLELYLGVTQSGQGIAHFAHLGGMAAGYALLVYWRSQARPNQR